MCVVFVAFRMPRQVFSASEGWDRARRDMSDR